MSVFLQPIYTATVGAGGVSSITFNNIPQGFTDLVLEISARSTSNDGIEWRTMNGYINSNTNPNYNLLYFLGTGSGVGSNYSTGGTVGVVGWIAGNLNKANTFSNTRTVFYNYSSGLRKTWVSESLCASDTANSLTMVSGVVSMSTDPITSITVYQDSPVAFVENSTFTLYGRSATFETSVPAAPTIGAVTDLAGEVSVAFTANDSGQANSYYAETTSGTLRTYGDTSPIVVQNVPKDSSLQYRAVAVNSLGSGTSSNSSAITTYNDFASIATASGVTSNIIFTNIPQHYQHLQLRIIARNNTGAGDISVARIKFNNDDTSSYSYHLLSGNGASVSTENGANQSNGIAVVWLVGGGLAANTYAASVVDILQYSTATKFKTVQAFTGTDLNGSGRVSFFSGNWRSVSPVSSVHINFDYGVTANNTTIALYGIG